MTFLVKMYCMPCEESRFYLLSFKLIREGKGMQLTSLSEFFGELAMLILEWVGHKKGHWGIIVSISTYRNFRQQCESGGTLEENGEICVTRNSTKSHKICLRWISLLYAFENFYFYFRSALHLLLQILGFSVFCQYKWLKYSEGCIVLFLVWRFKEELPCQ